MALCQSNEKGQFQTNEDIRHWLLEKASVAVVPFKHLI